MKLSQLLDLINLCYSEETIYKIDPEVVLSVKLPFSTVGPSASVPIKNAQLGFDWDSGKFIIYPAENVTPSDRDFESHMRSLQDKVARLDYENRNLKAQISRFNKRTTNLQ